MKECRIEIRDLTVRSPHTDKKENFPYTVYQEIEIGAVAMSYMRKGFLIYEEMRKYFPIYEDRRGGQNDDFRPLTYTLGEGGMGCRDKM
jgi:hypothetical protein